MAHRRRPWRPPTVTQQTRYRLGRAASVVALGFALIAGCRGLTIDVPAQGRSPAAYQGAVAAAVNHYRLTTGRDPVAYAVPSPNGWAVTLNDAGDCWTVTVVEASTLSVTGLTPIDCVEVDTLEAGGDVAVGGLADAAILFVGSWLGDGPIEGNDPTWQPAPLGRGEASLLTALDERSAKGVGAVTVTGTIGSTPFAVRLTAVLRGSRWEITGTTQPTNWRNR